MNLTAFPASILDVLNAYHLAVQHFNAGYGKPKTDPEWVALKGLLDAKVMITGIDKPKSYKGPSHVIDFLNAAQATFTNDIVSQTIPYGNKLVAVCGTADWQDNDHDNDGPLVFHFEFVTRDGVNWKILRLTATNPS